MAITAFSDSQGISKRWLSATRNRQFGTRLKLPDRGPQIEKRPPRAEAVCILYLTSIYRAGDGTRTHDVQLGKHDDANGADA